MLASLPEELKKNLLGPVQNLLPSDTTNEAWEGEATRREPGPGWALTVMGKAVPTRLWTDPGQALPRGLLSVTGLHWEGKIQSLGRNLHNLTHLFLYKKGEFSYRTDNS